MTAWVFPDHDHVIIVEMSSGDPEKGIDIHASHHATGEKCEKCNQAVRRLADLIHGLACGWFGLAPEPCALEQP